MKAYQFQAPDGVESLALVDLPKPEPGPGEVRVRVRANSLNYRDLIIASKGYYRNANYPTIPVSDMAGEVDAVGDGVEAWKPGDRVAANFLRDWIAGPPRERVLWSSLGGGVQGTLAEFVVLPAPSLVRVPGHLSFAEAATLPCAGVTAWNALAGSGLGPGKAVLLLGTGGVSIFGLQFAKAAGARAVVTSSSDAKLERAKALGADAAINYKQHPEWHEQVLAATGGRGVDIVVEVGGPGTLDRSMKSTAVGGAIALIGLLDMPEQQPSILWAMLNSQTIRGIYVGSVEMFEAMNRAIDANGIKPVVDRSFGFGAAKEAYGYFSQQKHIGKVVVEH